MIVARRAVVFPAADVRPRCCCQSGDLQVEVKIPEALRSVCVFGHRLWKSLLTEEALLTVSHTRAYFSHAKHSAHGNKAGICVCVCVGTVGSLASGQKLGVRTD